METASIVVYAVLIFLAFLGKSYLSNTKGEPINFVGNMFFILIMYPLLGVAFRAIEYISGYISTFILAPFDFLKF